jgi:hypothetical protein
MCGKARAPGPLFISSIRREFGLSRFLLYILAKSRPENEMPNLSPATIPISLACCGASYVGQRLQKRWQEPCIDSERPNASGRLTRVIASVLLMRLQEREELAGGRSANLGCASAS